MPQNRPSLAVTLVGKNTHFAQGTTKADFHLSGSATATTVTVTSPTTATAQLTLPAGTPTGRYTVTLTTGLEVAEAVDAFMVTPTPDNVSNICAAANNLGNLFQGASSTMTGAIEADGVADWFKVSFSAGTTLNLTLRNAVAGTGGSEFQMQVFSACGIPLGAATTGGGQKTLTVPDSGPHAVIVRVFASVWNVAGPMYSLVLDGR